MTRNYYLIKNTSGYTYWSYRMDESDWKEADAIEQDAIAKYGTIYVNRNGGWFTEDNVDSVLRVVKACKFPKES